MKAQREEQYVLSLAFLPIPIPLAHHHLKLSMKRRTDAAEIKRTPRFAPGCLIKTTLETTVSNLQEDG